MTSIITTCFRRKNIKINNFIKDSSQKISQLASYPNQQILIECQTEKEVLAYQRVSQLATRLFVIAAAIFILITSSQPLAVRLICLTQYDRKLPQPIATSKLTLELSCTAGEGLLLLMISTQVLFHIFESSQMQMPISYGKII